MRSSSRAMSSALRPLEVRCSGSAPALSSRRTISVSLGFFLEGANEGRQNTTATSQLIKTSKIKKDVIFDMSLTYRCHSYRDLYIDLE